MKHIKPFSGIFIGIVAYLLLIIDFPASAQTGSQWKNLGPYGGVITGLVADTKNPGTLLSGTETGEIYKTTDNGQNWFYLNTVGKPIRTMIIDTINTNNVYVFARHEVDGVSPQVFVSTNGGISWSSSYSLDFGNVFDAVINPLNTTQLYAISRDKIVKSINKGLSWSPVRLAEDTSILTAMAVNPQDPFYNFYVAYINEDTQSVIQVTNDYNYTFETKLILPTAWVVTKMFVAKDPYATVFAVLGMDGQAYDSIKIISSQNNGNSWNTVFANRIDYRFESTENLEAYRWLTFSDAKTYVINLPNGIYKSNNGGFSWQELERNYHPSTLTEYLTPAPNDTTTFFAVLIPYMIKFTLGSTGSLGAVQISNGLTAFPIKEIMYVDEQNMIASINKNNDHVLLISQNQGLDNEILTTSARPFAAFYSYMSESFIWIEENGKICYTENGRDTTCLQAPFTGTVTNGFSMNYFFNDDTLKTLMIVAVLSADANKGIWKSEDDGETWTNITFNSGLNNPIMNVKSIAAYPTRVNDQDRIRILAAADNSIHATLLGGATWNNNVFQPPTGSTIKEISSDKNTIMISTTGTSGPGLHFSRLENNQWNTSDVTSTIQNLFNQNGPGQIIHVNSAIDGNYLILEHYQVNQPTKRKLYKVGYDPENIRWVEITEPPVDLFLFNSIGTNYVFEDYSFNVYAAANNGIWKLEQVPIITHDTMVTAPSAEVLTGESDFYVTYRNAGTAFGEIETFIIQNDPEGNFSFADSNDVRYGLFLDIKTGTPLEMFFHPRSTGLKEAELIAFLRQPKPNGVDDSLIELKTRLKGQAKYSQIGTGLKGDSLNMGATMIGTSITKTFYVKNTGTETLEVYDIYLEDAGTSFDLLMDTTEFSLLPGESKPVTIEFDAGPRDSLITGECWIYSSSYNSQHNRPDTLRKISLSAQASWMQWVQSGDPVLNQSYTLDVWLTDMKNSTATAVLKYWQTGSSSTSPKSRALTQVPYPDNHLHLSVNIPPEDITEKGISFYIEVTNGNQIRRYPEKGDISPIRLGVRIPSPGLNSSSWVTLPGGTSRKDYRMVSFPIDLDNKSVQSAFAMSYLGELGDKGDWQLYRWDRSLSRFIKANDGSQSFGDIYSGKSYLLITRQSKTLNSGTGKTVLPDSAKTIIFPGWNMISNPYTFPISWTTLAQINDKVETRNLVVLNNGRFEYVDINSNQLFRLEPWKGYFYYSDTSAFIMRFPPNDATLFGKEISGSVEPYRYKLKAEIIDERGDRLSAIEFGEHTEALSGRDNFDKVSLPSFSDDDVQIQLIAQDGKKLHSDFRPVSESGTSWDFELIGLGRDQTASLSFSGAENLADGYMLAVLNRTSGKLDYITPGKDLRVRGSAKDAVQYRVIAGTKDYIESQTLNTIPSEFYLAQNYPNPFNPSTTIHYGLPSSSNVELIIYNSLGQKVRTLYSGIQNAGQQRIVWNGRNDNGTPVSSGIYIFRASIRSLEDGGHFRQSRKMMLIK